MKKIYIKPLAEFEEIEDLDILLDKDSKYDYSTEGSGTGGTDNNPDHLPWGGDTPGTDPDDGAN
jgi:hypothetical protein